MFRLFLRGYAYVSQESQLQLFLADHVVSTQDCSQLGYAVAKCFQDLVHSNQIYGCNTNALENILKQRTYINNMAFQRGVDPTYGEFGPEASQQWRMKARHQKLYVVSDSLCSLGT